MMTGIVFHAHCTKLARARAPTMSSMHEERGQERQERGKGLVQATGSSRCRGPHGIKRRTRPCRPRTQLTLPYT